MRCDFQEEEKPKMFYDAYMMYLCSRIIAV